MDRALNATALTRRGRFWVRLLRRASPGGLGGHVAYLVSAFEDTWGYVVHRGANPVPRARRSLTLRLRDSGVLLAVRRDTDDVVHALPRREQDVHDAILDGLGPGDTFVDVGANIGYYSVLAAMRVAPGGTVIAIEPVHSTAEALRRNVRANGLSGVRVVEVAVGPVGLERAAVFLDPRHLGRATLRGAQEPEAHDVRVQTLDEVCGDLDRITLIKIDVEGGELGALKGAERILERTASVVVECNEEGPAVDRFLERRGFVVSRLHFTNHRLARKVWPRQRTVSAVPRMPR